MYGQKESNLNIKFRPYLINNTARYVQVVTQQKGSSQGFSCSLTKNLQDDLPLQNIIQLLPFYFLH